MLPCLVSPLVLDMVRQYDVPQQFGHVYLNGEELFEYASIHTLIKIWKTLPNGYVVSNPKTTRVTAIRIFITSRKGLKVFKPLSNFYKNICDRVRESESKMMKHEKIDK